MTERERTLTRLLRRTLPHLDTALLFYANPDGTPQDRRRGRELLQLRADISGTIGVAPRKGEEGTGN